MPVSELPVGADKLQRFFNGLKLKFATAAQGKKADTAVPNTRKINGKALSGDIVLTAADVGALAEALLPPGFIGAYGGTAAPEGWLLCNGQAVSRTTYARLFAAVGVTYGSGNGSTTFNVPDIRGRVVVGSDANLPGAKAGEERHTILAAEMPKHTHPVVYSSDQNVVGLNNGDSDTSYKLQWTKGASPVANMFAAEVGGYQPHNNVQPSLYLNYVIKV